MKLSIIVPVYNTGVFLRKCIDSCLSQNISYADYEIIILNDGSTDNSFEIATLIAEKYPNVSLYSHDNCGLSLTRNKGLKLAKGDYVWFVDSDDWIRENCLKEILDDCYNNDLDAYQVGACNVIDDKLERIYDVTQNKISTGLELLKCGGFYVCAPFTIYKKKYLINNHLEFCSGIFHEDCEFTPRAYYGLKRVSGTNNYIYYVFCNPNSITHTINPKRLYDLLFIIKKLGDFSANFDVSTRRIYSSIISNFINLLFRFGNELPVVEKEKLSHEIVRNKSIFKYFFMSNVFKYKMEALLFYVFPSLPLKIIKLIS